MKLEIAYMSKLGNAKKLAGVLAEMFSGHELSVTDLSESSASLDADIYFLGFDIVRDTMPLRIIETLETVDKKAVLMFGTCTNEPTAEYEDMIDRKIIPFLPLECDYLGLFLSPGQLGSSDRELAERMAADYPDNEHTSQLLERLRCTNGHPNDEDILRFHEFVFEQLTQYSKIASDSK